MLLNIIHDEISKLELLDHTSLVNSLETSLQKAFVENKDIGLVKQNITDNKIERTGMEILFGFYAEMDVSFDLYLQDEFFAHYDLVKGKFYPISKKDDKYYVFPLLNLPYMKDTFVKNVSLLDISKEKDIFKKDVNFSDIFFLVGAVLKHETYRAEFQQEIYCKNLVEIYRV